MFAINHRRPRIPLPGQQTRHVSIHKSAIFAGRGVEVVSETDGLSQSYLFLDRVHGLSGSLDTSSSAADD